MIINKLIYSIIKIFFKIICTLISSITIIGISTYKLGT